MFSGDPIRTINSWLSRGSTLSWWTYCSFTGCRACSFGSSSSSAMACLVDATAFDFIFGAIVQFGGLPSEFSFALKKLIEAGVVMDRLFLVAARTGHVVRTPCCSRKKKNESRWE